MKQFTWLALILVLALSLFVTACQQQNTAPTTSAPAPQATNKATETAISIKPGQTSNITQIVVQGKITFENDKKPTEAKELGEKAYRKKFYAYRDTSVDVEIKSLQFKHKEGMLLVDDSGNFAFVLSFDKPLTLPLEAGFTFKREGYKDITLNKIKVNTNPLVLPSSHMTQ